MIDFLRGFLWGLLVAAIFASIRGVQTDVEVDAAVKNERPEPIFEHGFDPSRAAAPRDCGDRQWIAERGPNQHFWSYACVDFRQR